MHLKSVIRFDSMPMPRAYFTPEGFLRDRPILTSCGIFEYTNPDGSVRRELRLPEDVFSPESLRSYKGAPVVLTHEAGLIDKNNVAENQIGTVLSEGERSGDDVKAEIIIHDTDAMRSAGLKELSLGYNLDLDETPGVWNGQRYDAIQRNIRINHLALVREARAGEQARLNLDGRDQVSLLKGGKRMSKKIKRVPHADAVLTDEELDKALEEYDKKYGNNTNTAPDAQVDAEDEEVVEEEPVVEEQPAPSDDVEEQVENVKARRDKRDEEGDPEDVDAAMGMIAHQDEDIQTLLDIIDTLRARLDLGAEKTDAEDEEVVEEEEPAEEEEVQEDEVDDLETLKGKENEDADDEEEPVDEELPEDEDGEDEELPEDEEEFAEDADDEEEAPEDEEEDDFLTDGADCEEMPNKRMDSVDRLVNMKIALGELGDRVGIRGLARKPVRQAKIEIIRAVRPNARMDGKSDVYINEAFKVARDTIKARSRKTVADQKKQMYNRKPATNMDASDKGSAMAARDRMIAKYANRNK